MSEHMFVLDPPARFSMKMWSPWKCLCGVGGTGATDSAAEYQYRMHVAGYWPAYIAPHPNAPDAVVFEGQTIWTKVGDS